MSKCRALSHDCRWLFHTKLTGNLSSELGQVIYWWLPALRQQAELVSMVFTMSLHCTVCVMPFMSWPNQAQLLAQLPRKLCIDWTTCNSSNNLQSAGFEMGNQKEQLLPDSFPQRACQLCHLYRYVQIVEWDTLIQWRVCHLVCCQKNVVICASSG